MTSKAIIAAASKIWARSILDKRSSIKEVSLRVRMSKKKTPQIGSFDKDSEAEKNTLSFLNHTPIVRFLKAPILTI